MGVPNFMSAGCSRQRLQLVSIHMMNFSRKTLGSALISISFAV